MNEFVIFAILCVCSVVGLIVSALLMWLIYRHLGGKHGFVRYLREL